MEELGGSDQVLQSIDRVRRQARLATGAEASASSLLEDFGFTGDRLTARLDDLSGGERRRLQILRLLLDEPNVLLLDEPTNDLDIDTLTVIEDYLDSWPGTLLVVTHDRYFLERVCDVSYALMGDGSCVLLPGGVEQYLQSRRDRPWEKPTAPSRRWTLARRGARRVGKQERTSHAWNSRSPAWTSDSPPCTKRWRPQPATIEQLNELQREIELITATKDELELAWLQAADIAG